MEINTKFNVGDTVYTISPKTFRMTVFEVGRVIVFTTEDERSVSYKAKGSSPYDDSYNENVCFGTCDELMEYIKND